MTVMDCPWCAPDEECAVCLGITAAGNPYHEPGGSPKGGEFAHKPGGDFATRVKKETKVDGVWDEDGPVLFWPSRINSREGEPMWKALVDDAGDEKAFWFGERSFGSPDHISVRHILGLPASTRSVVGYGSKGDAAAILGGDHADSDAVVTAIRRRHWRDIRDAKEMLQGIVAAASAPPFTPEQFTRSVNASTRMAEAAITSTLADAYEKALRSVAADAARRFRVMATPLTAAIGDESAVAADPQFLAPDPMELVPKAKLQEEIEKRTRQIREQVVAVTVGGLLTQAGIDFSVGGIFSQAILDRVGARVRDADLSTRDAVRTVINRAQDEGWSVPQTATAIKAHIEDLAPSTATQLARTDLIGTSNASATAAAKMVFAGTPVVKRWLATEDERTRPTHDAADGQTVPLNGSFTVGGARMDYPGDPSGPDAEVCNCRCTLLFEEEGDLSLSASAWQSVVAAMQTGGYTMNMVQSETVTAAAVDFTDGSMVALFPTPEQAEALALPDGQPADTLHVTLAFLPEGVEEPEWLAERLAALATWFPPLAGTVGGLGMFAPGDDGVPVIALPDVVGLADLRVAVCELLAESQVVVADTHGFVPHLTLTYGDARMDPPLGFPLTFSSLSLVVGAERWDVPFGAAIVAAFDPSKHARVKAGTRNRKRDPREGGQFAPKEGGQGGKDDDKPKVEERHPDGTPKGWGLGQNYKMKPDQVVGQPGGVPQAAAPDAAAREILKGAKDTQQLYKGSGPFGYTTERVATVQNPILETDFAKALPNQPEPTSLFMAGGPGSGKSSVLDTGLTEIPPDAVTINPDLIKERIPEYDEMKKAGSTYAAAGTHEESSDIAKRETRVANSGGYNSVIDGTGDSGADKFMAKINEAKAAGRNVKVVMVDLPTDESVRRAQERGRKSGRVVPEAEIRSQHQNVAKNHLVWRDQVDDWEVWDNDVARGQPPILIARREGGGKIEVLDEARYQQALDKATEVGSKPKRRLRRNR